MCYLPYLTKKSLRAENVVFTFVTVTALQLHALEIGEVPQSVC